MKRSRLVSVVIITKNRKHQLIRCIKSVAQQTYRPSQIVIIDSSDNEQGDVIGGFKIRGTKISYYYKPFYSIPKARQEGIDKSENSIVLFLDDDCTAEKLWVEKMVRLSYRFSNSVLIAGKLLHYPSTSVYAQIISNIRKRRLSLAGNDKYIYFNIENCLIRKNLLKKYRVRFDEAMYNEEFADFAIQIASKGGLISITDQSIVYHHERLDIRNFLKQRFKNSGNLARLKLKWPSYRFHFFSSSGLSFLRPFFVIISSKIKSRRYFDILKIFFVITLSVIVYMTGSFCYAIQYNVGIRKYYSRVKDILDPLASFFILLICFPVLLLIIILIKIDSPGPIIFSQIRVGKNFKKFRFYKFRTMWSDARKRFPDLYKYSYDNSEINQFRFKTENDPRLTTLGKYLRRTSLDELPNLINVIRGDMYLVGPRPEIPEMIRYYSEEEKIKFSVKPGVTGISQVKGRGLLTFKQGINYDCKYVYDQSVFTDIGIILSTIYVVIRGIGAF